MEDSLHHRQLRQNLVETLRQKGIQDENVLTAISRVPRHLFVDPSISSLEAYEDKPLSIGENQTISQPYTVAYQSQLLDVRRGQKILEIGTGSGYQAAILFEMGAQVHTLERFHSLYDSARVRLLMLGYSGIFTYHADGYGGLPQEAPFDRIIITAAATDIPSSLVPQLSIEGSLVAPMNGSTQKMVKLIRHANANEVMAYDEFTFVPMLPGLM